MEKILDSKQFYDCWSRGFDSYSVLKRPYLKKIDQLVGEIIKDNCSIIDIGSGTGRRIEKIGTKFKLDNIVCLDSSPVMTAISKKRGLKSFCGDIAFDLHKLFTTESFSWALCLWNVLGHVQNESDRLKALENINFILKPGGELIIDVNNRYNYRAYGLAVVLKNLLLDLFLRYKHEYTFSLANNKKLSTKVHIFSKKEIISLLKKTGFSIEKICFIDYKNGETKNSQFFGQIMIRAKKI